MSASGKSGPSTTSNRSDWGLYQGPLEDRLLACEDYVGRLRRCLDGEIAPDRHYFDEKAHLLRDAAQSLVERIEDVEWWMGTCTEQHLHIGPDADSTYLADCGRTAGHDGLHEDEARCAERRVLEELRAVTRTLQHATDGLAWGLLTIRADAGVTDPETLAAGLRSLPARLSKAVSAVAALARPGYPER